MENMQCGLGRMSKNIDQAAFWLSDRGMPILASSTSARRPISASTVSSAGSPLGSDRLAATDFSFAKAAVSSVPLSRPA